MITDMYLLNWYLYVNAEEMTFRFHFLLLCTTYYAAQNMDTEPELLKRRLSTAETYCVT